MNFSDIRNLLTEYPNIPPPKLNDFILEGMQDFCMETWEWTEWDTFFLSAGTAEYTLTPSESNSDILGIPPDGVERALIATPEPTASAGDSGTLVPTTTYYYKVTAYQDNYGETLPCAEVSATVTATGAVDLDWDAVNGADGYKVYRSTSSGGTFYLMDDGDVSTNAYTDDGGGSAGTTVPPTKSNLVKSIDLMNTGYEKAQYRYWRTREGSGIDRISWDGATTIRMSMIPDSDADNIGMQIEIALQPSAPITFPTILEKRKHAFADYARFKIHAHPATPVMIWYDAKLAQFYYQKYTDVRNLAKSMAMSGQGGQLRAYNQFWA